MQTHEKPTDPLPESGRAQTDTRFAADGVIGYLSVDVLSPTIGTGDLYTDNARRYGLKAAGILLGAIFAGLFTLIFA